MWFSKVISAIAVCLFAVCFAASAAVAPTIVMADKEKWVAGTGDLAGVQVAVLSGDPSKAVPYLVRLKIPAGGKFGVHFHPKTEHVTVISGALWVGLGDTIDEKKMTELPAGSFASVPPNLHHYAMVKDATVIQIDGIGPDTMTAVKAHKR